MNALIAAPVGPKLSNARAIGKSHQIQPGYDSVDF
jgi:hypothetical protein